MGALCATSATVAFFLASGAGQLLVARHLALGAAPRATSPIPVDAGPPSSELVEAILAGQLFSHEVEVPPQPPVLPPGTETVLCAASMRLIAAVVVPGAPALSFAAIQSGQDALLYRAGSHVDDFELVGIREQRVFLRRAGDPLCELAMFAAEQMTRAAPEQPADKRSKPGARDQETASAIQRVGDNEYTVTRAFFDHVLSNPMQVLQRARFIPSSSPGQPGGKLYGIRKDGPLHRLGLRNGDVLRSINGFDMSRADAALEAYAQLRSADRFTLAVSRRSRELRMQVSVR